MPGSDCVKLNGNPTFTSTSSYDFKSDGTFSVSGGISYSVDASYDDACAMTTAMTDAATLCATFTQEASFLATSGITISCAMKGAVCDCKESAMIPLDETGTYTVSGSSITLTPDASTNGSTTSTPLDGTSEFCVSGSTVNVQGSDGTITTLTKK
jgi:hypothetical protein